MHLLINQNNMKQYILSVSFFLSCIVTFTACNDFLDKEPSKSAGVTISQVDELEALLNKNNFGSGTLDKNYASILSSDAFELNTEYYDKGFSKMNTTPEVYQIICWQMGLTNNTNENASMWSANFSSIYLANLVLENISKVKGSKEKIDEVSYKAHLLRAYNYLELACYYCMPYGQKTLNELGLPIKQKTSYDENMRRVSLKETYDFIEKDVLEAVKLTAPLFEDNVRKSWKETGATANSLAARFYLLKGDYEQAKNYAKKALDFGNDLLDFNNPDEIAGADVLSFSDHSIIKMSTWWKPINTKQTFRSEKDREYYSKDNYYLSINLWGVPSPKLLNAYNHQYDMRYRYFIVPNFQKVFFMGMFANKFTMDVPGYGVFDGVYTTGPNVAEMRLIYAECLARTGNIAEAMTQLNDFRKYRIDKNAPSNVINLTATDKQNAVALILKERMMEFPFSKRWNDIRRCNFNDDPTDDITIVRHFYDVEANSVNKDAIKTYELTPSSRNYPVAIPNAEIVISKGAIEQNKY